MKAFDRRALFASGAAAALLAATGVSAAPVRGGQLRAALSGAARSDRLDVAPHGLFMQAARAAVFENLTEIAADGTLRGELATAWRASDDGRVWEFDLRENVTFHDGAQLSADDVRLPGLNVDALSSARIVIALDTPDYNLPFRLAAPSFAVLPSDPARAAAGIGTGLYRVEKFDPGRHFIGARVDAHWKDGTAGWFDRIDFVHFSDPAIRAEALAAAMVDAADLTEIDAPPADFQRLPSDRHVQQVVRHDIRVPVQIGHTYPLDNLRFAERWWRS